MDDDVNTADAVSVIFELAKLINSNVDENSSLEFAKNAQMNLMNLQEY